MDLAFDRTDRQCDQVWIILQSSLETRIVTGIGERANAAGNLKCTSNSTHDIAVALTVQFNLSGLVPNQLGLVAAFNGAQFLRAPTGQQSARQSQRQKADQQQHCQHDIEKTNSVEGFEHEKFRKVKGDEARPVMTSGHDATSNGRSLS